MATVEKKATVKKVTEKKKKATVKISTSEILELLKADSDHTKFFYLYVSTSGRVEEEEEDSDSESSGEEKDISQQMLPLSVQENPVAQNTPVSPSTPPKKARENAMSDVHSKILPKLLYPHGWKKVHDHDLNLTYRALYFNTIEKQPDENDNEHIQRVDEYRKMIRDEVEKLKEEQGVNFKINSLLSRPLLYDPKTLQEQSTREKSTLAEETSTN